jgi:hypothetical protein
MALNQNLLRRRSTTSKSSTSPHIRPGVYHSRVIAVNPADGYELGAAFEVVYELSDGNSTFEYREIFLTDIRNTRTFKLDEYLTENNVTFDDWQQLVGLEEQLTFEKQSRNGRVYVNVTDREFVRYSPEDPA